MISRYNTIYNIVGNLYFYTLYIVGKSVKGLWGNL